MSEESPRIEEIINRLREHGLRLTPQRMAVLKTLVGNKEHLSAEDIYAQVRITYPMIGLATVYNTISMLKELGAISELNFGNGLGASRSYNRAHFDGSGEAPHPHFVCTRCNRIIDIEGEIFGDLPNEVARQTGYHITGFRLDFFGLCPNCQ